MKLIRKIGKAVHFFRKEDKKKIFTTMRVIRKQYGISGMLRAVHNKMSGRPALYGFPAESGIEGNVFPVQRMEDMGNEILKEQQSELSTDEKREQMVAFAIKPLFSVVMPLYNAPVKWLEKAVESLQAQCYENWELCAVDDGSKDRRGIDLINRMMANDSRIRLTVQEKNSGISAASNVSLEMAQGEYIALMDQDDELPSDALFWFAKEINEHPEADFIYSDECKVNTEEGHGRVYSCFYLKPDWSPMLLINHMYTGHFTIYRTSVARKVGGFRTKYDFSQDYDLALRVSDITDNIRHIERVLYYWRIIPSSAASGAKDFARVSNIGAVADWYKRQDLNAMMEKRMFSNYGSIVRAGNPKVSIIIPSDSYKNLMKCIDGLLCKTSYKHIEIIPVTNSKTAAEIEEDLWYLEHLNISHYDKVYNFSDKCNEGAKIASGEILIFLNDDVIPKSKDWIERLIEILLYPKVGGVSPLMLRTNDTVQYAGMITGTPGMIGTSFNGIPNKVPVPNPFKHPLMRNVSILNGACTVMRKDVFEEIGGFDIEHTPTGHSDLDLSLKLIEKGYQCVYTPHAVMYHIGNHSWEQKNKVDKADIYTLKRWGQYIAKDPYFTDSMKRTLYTDFTYHYQIHSPKNLVVPDKPGARDMLFITHELTRTGAPIVLKDMVKIVLDNGDFPVVLSMQDGPLMQDYLDMGVTVIVDESIRQRHWMFERFARNFDLVVANTMSCFDVIYTLEDSMPPVLWWLHEGSYALDLMRKMLIKNLPNNVHVFSISDYTTQTLKRYGINYPVETLCWGINEISNIDAQTAADDRVLFVVAGSIEERKGQDIVIDAINNLDKETRKKAKFVFVGKPLEADIFSKLKKAEEMNDNIEYMETMPREDVLKLYQNADCCIVASRDEPMSLVAVEAAMLSKPAICSDHTGFTQFIKHGENGTIFTSGNALDLAKKIEEAINRPKDLYAMGLKARMIYEQNFTFEAYREKLLNTLQEIVGR